MQHLSGADLEQDVSISETIRLRSTEEAFYSASFVNKRTEARRGSVTREASGVNRWTRTRLPDPRPRA